MYRSQRTVLRKMLNHFFKFRYTTDCNKADIKTMEEAECIMMERLGIDPGYVLTPKPRDYLLEHTPKIEDLPARSMQDSFTSALIPLSSSRVLRDKYTSVMGHVRIGRLLEDIDLFAVWVCHQHVHLPKLPEGTHLPYTFVTVRVDKVDIETARHGNTNDILLSGHISGVGRSTLEVTIWLDQLLEPKPFRITRAVFLMAARNANNTAAAPVNPLKPSDDKEAAIVAEAEKRREMRKQLLDTSLFKVQPNIEEQAIMYELFKRTTNLETMDLNQRILPPGAVWMYDSHTITTIMPYPEHRNVQNTVFGGYLMRAALEVAWTTAVAYCKGQYPAIMHVNDVTFEKPVALKSILKLSATVLFTKDNYLQIMTIADIIDPIASKQMTSNVFYFTLTTPEPVPEVLPRTYHETIMYIQGRRVCLEAIRNREQAAKAGKEEK